MAFRFGLGTHHRSFSVVTVGNLGDFGNFVSGLNVDC